MSTILEHSDIFDDIPFRDRGQQQRTPVLLMLDGSSSMGNPSSKYKTRIDELNNCLVLLQNALHADEVARSRVCISIIVVSNDQPYVAQRWVDAGAWVAPVITAEGGTPLGAGCIMALDSVTAICQELAQQRIPRIKPWIVVMSDGEPTDKKWRQGSAALRQAEQQGILSVTSLGVDGADLAVLSEMSIKPALPLASKDFPEFVRWLAKSVSIMSVKAPGTLVQLAAPSGWLHTT